MSKSKLKELANIVNTFIAVITDLEEAYEEKPDDFLWKNDSVILEADNH